MDYKYDEETGRLMFTTGRFLQYNDTSGELKANVSFTRSLSFIEVAIPSFPLEILGCVILITTASIIVKFAGDFKKLRKSPVYSR